MSDYEKELERTVDQLREKLQDYSDMHERMKKSTNSELFDIKSIISQFGDILFSMRNPDESKSPQLNDANRKLLSIHDSLHNRILNLLDRFKE
jgi:hypothetical protein